MPKTERFTFKLDEEERRLLALLARRLQRTQSDTLRCLIWRAAMERGGWGERERGAELLGIVGDWEVPFSEAGEEPF